MKLFTVLVYGPFLLIISITCTIFYSEISEGSTAMKDYLHSFIYVILAASYLVSLLVSFILFKGVRDIFM